MGKNLSFIFKAIGGLYIIVAYFVSKPTDINSVLPIAVIGIVIANIFLPVDISKIMEKFTNKE